MDVLGRPTRVVHPNGRIDYFIYNDVSKQVRVYAGLEHRHQHANVAHASDTFRLGQRICGGPDTMSAAPVTLTDRHGTVHTLSYDVLGRLVADTVTTLGAGVDGSVRRIEYGYDVLGNLALITSYDVATGGNVVNQIKREFNGLGQLTSEWQEHGGVVSGSSPLVQYAYSEMTGGANHSRLTSIIYPNGKVLSYNYAAGLDDAISRLSWLSDNTGVLESYDYLGESVVVARKHPQPGIDLTYVKRTGEANGDAGDQYTGLDRFGRIVDQRWLKSSDGSAIDRLQYSYDRNGNRLSRTNLQDIGSIADGSSVCSSVRRRGHGIGGGQEEVKNPYHSSSLGKASLQEGGAVLRR
ncbi:MAG: hypothetical protein RMJ88_13190 [Thermogemmata sp.]|nr:hypothetical protein [Thermogemmata sp.]